MTPTSLLPLLLLLLLSPPPTTPQPTPTPTTPTPTPTPTLLPPIPLFSPSPSPSPLSCPTPSPTPSGLTFTQIMSRVMGGASISCWIFVTAPQIYKNYKNGTAEAIAFAFIMCWVLGDLTNLLGCLLTHQLLTQTALAVYYVFADAFMVAQIVYYKVRDSRRKYAPLDQELKSGTSDKGGPPTPSPRLSTQNIAVGAAVVGATLSQTVSASSSDPCNPGKSDIEILGVTFAWTSAALYLSSRVPQVYKNFKRKSTDGLSFGMFVLTVAGNCTYAASIFLESRNKEYLLNSLPYIVGSLGTLSFDLLVWFQFWLYGSMSKKKDLYDLEDIPPPPQYRPKTLNNLRSNYYEKLGVREEVGEGRGQDVDLPAYNEFGEKIDMI